MKKYFPILLSKKGEIGALQYLAQTVKDDVCPLIEVLQETLEKKETVKGVTTTVYKEEFEKFLKTHWKFFENQIILDFSLFQAVEEKIIIIKQAIVSLITYGVNVIPAIQSNSHPKLIDLVKELIRDYRVNICFRNSDNSGGIDSFKNGIEWLADETKVAQSNIILLLDLGYIKGNSYNTIAALAKSAINSLNSKIEDWYAVVVASSSFPPDLGEFKPANKVYRIDRYEWKVWELIKKDPVFSNVRYGDFGTKYPYYIEAGFAGSVSIKYSIKDEYVIYKGELTENHKEGHGQYILHAFKLTMSSDYSGSGFSWGDKKIKEIAHENVKDDKRKTGSSTTWVQISQNHHITLLHSLL